MVENLGLTNIRNREVMETKENMQSLSQGSWQLFHVCLAFVSSSPICNPSSSPTPKRWKTTMNGGEDPMRSGRAFQHP